MMFFFFFFHNANSIHVKNHYKNYFHLNEDLASYFLSNSILLVVDGSYFFNHILIIILHNKELARIVNKLS